MRFPTKIVVVLRDDLEAWQRVNATAFMVSGIAAGTPETVGEPYEDATGNIYNSMFREPVYVYEASAAKLLRAFDRARQREVTVSLFTDELFVTGHDAANRAAVKAVAEPDLSLVGIAFRADRKVADKVTDGLSFHR
ncbi:MAG: DUF2000 family protein [Thermomicrobiales bacterium]